MRPDPHPDRLMRWTLVIAALAASTAVWWPAPVGAAAAARTGSGAPALGWPAERLTRSPWVRWRSAAASHTSIT